MERTGAQLLFANVYINIKIISYNMSVVSTIFNNIGSYGPALLFLNSCSLLWNKETLLFYYVVGIFLNSVLNVILKLLFKQPRPSEDERTFKLALTHGKYIVFKDGYPHSIFGMPSGHTQTSVFSLIFIYLSGINERWLYFYSIIIIIVMSQRVAFNHHTIFQVIIGAFVGAFVGYQFFFLAKQKIKGRITEKPDDYAPI